MAMKRNGTFGILLAAVLLVGGGASLAEDLHFTYLWHMEQPIYWPVRQGAGPDRYERAWESIQQTDAGRVNPRNDLREIFQTADRVAAYQFRPRDAVDLMRQLAPEAGVQVSFSGGLIENLQSLGNAGQLGYGPTWSRWYREARNWSTPSGSPRLDVVLFPFHHPLLPLCDENTVRKQIQLYKLVYGDTWSSQPTRSRGCFPSEMAFSERLIPILVQENVDWVIVSNEHISRACENFPLVLGSGGVNCEPPNAADRLNPPQSDWFRLSISRGNAPANAVPFAYTPHYSRYLDPQTGDEYKLIVVPAAQALGWVDGSQPFPQSHLDTLNAFNDPARPMLVLLAHDGDNFFGGGFSYYMEATPNLVNQATAAGYVATTVEQYLANHPVPADDVVHVEDGAWVNADADFGSPTFLNWNWPLLDASGQVDIANGWHVDERNWAVITAAQNRVDTAEQIAGGVDLAQVLAPSAAASPAERAWHYFNGALNSGFMYFGTTLDHEVKPAVACNIATSHADQVILDGAADTTPPTIWIPQRWPYNPGSVNFGAPHGYQQVVDDGDFWVWTFAYDVSGLDSVVLKLRTDQDGRVDDDNRTYVGGPGVDAWQTLPMTRRPFPATNVYNDPGIDFFVLPQYIADQYTVEVTGYREVLLDYYVEAVDARGVVKRSPIQHVFVGDGEGSTGGPTDRVTFAPNPGVAGAPLQIDYDPTNGPLASAATVFAHLGYDDWSIVLPDFALTWDPQGALWTTTINVPAEVIQVDVAFNDGAGTWDNNNGQDWHLPVEGGSASWVLDGTLEPTAKLVAANGSLEMYAEHRNGRLYVAVPQATAGADHFLFVAAPPGPTQNAPWAKVGLVARWSAFVGNEGTNGWSGWFDLVPNGFGQTGSGPGGWLEMVIDIDAQFGTRPEALWLAFAPYQTQDRGALLTTMQVPMSTDDDTLVDASEYAQFVIAKPALLGDLNCDGAVTVSDINAFVLALTDADAYADAYPDCDPLSGDCSADGAVTVSDINCFVALVVGR